MQQQWQQEIAPASAQGTTPSGHAHFPSVHVDMWYVLALNLNPFCSDGRLLLGFSVPLSNTERTAYMLGFEG
jgi:hypothetical protein